MEIGVCLLVESYSHFSQVSTFVSHKGKLWSRLHFLVTKQPTKP